MAIYSVVTIAWISYHILCLAETQAQTGELESFIIVFFFFKEHQYSLIEGC